MINEEEKFDDLIRSKLSERDFFFDELNWQKESELIERNENKRKKRRFILIFFSGLGAGVALTFSILSLWPNSETNKIAGTFNTRGSTTSRANTIATVPLPDNGNKQKAITSDRPTNRTAKNSSPSDNNSAKNGRASGNSAHYIASALHTSTPAKNHAAHIRNNQNNLLTSVSSLYNNAAAKYTSSKTYKRDKANENNSSPAMAYEQPVKTNQNPDKTASKKNTTTGDNMAGITEEPKSNGIMADNNNNLNKSSTNPDSNTALTKQQKKADDSSIAKITDPADTGAIPIIKPSLAHTTLGFDLGGGYSIGWKGKAGNEANGLSPVIGMHLTHFFNKKAGVSVGIQYNSLVHLKTGYSNSSTTYDFGYNNNTTTVTPKTLHYVTVPITLIYKLDDKNSLSAGVSLLYLLNTSSTVNTTAQNELNPPSNHSKTSFGYTNGFNKMDIQAHLAYRRKIYKGISARLEGYYGFMDIETNSFFSDNSFQRNSGLRLILSYDFAK